MEKIFEAIDKNEAQFMQFLKDIVCLESYTPVKADVDALADYIRDFSLHLGFRVQIHIFEKSGNGLVVSWNEDAPLPPVTVTSFT